MPRDEGTYYLDADASDIGLGALRQARYPKRRQVQSLGINTTPTVAFSKGPRKLLLEMKDPKSLNR